MSVRGARKVGWLVLGVLLNPLAALACPIEGAADQGLLKKPQTLKLPPTSLDKTQLWDSWLAIKQTPDGPLFIRYVLSATVGNYLPESATVNQGSSLYQKIVERDRHDFAYLRVFTSRDRGRTWQDEGPQLSLPKGPVWTGGTIFRGEQSKVFLTIPERREGDWKQSIWLANSRDGIRLQAPQEIMTPQEMQRRAQQQNLPYDFLSDANGHVSAFRDFFSFELPASRSGQPSKVGGIVAAKQWVNGELLPTFAQLEASNTELTQWQLRQPIRLEKLDLPTYELEVPNLVSFGERQLLHFSVSYRNEAGEYIRGSYAAESTAPLG